VAQVHAIWASTERATNGVAVRQELKVLQKKVAKSVEDRYPVKFLPEKAFSMEPVQLHMLLNLIISEDETMLNKAKIAPLKALLVAYAKEGTTAMTGGTKAVLVPRVAAAIRAAGTTGFARAPVFGVKAAL